MFVGKATANYERRGSQEEQRENKSLLDFRGKQTRDFTQPLEGLMYQTTGHSEGQDLHGHSLEVRVSGLDCSPLFLQGFWHHESLVRPNYGKSSFSYQILQAPNTCNEQMEDLGL